MQVNIEYPRRSKLNKPVLLPELPGQVQNKPDQSKGYGNIETRNQVVVCNPPGKNLSPDHNPDIWNEKSQDTEYRQAV